MPDLNRCWDGIRRMREMDVCAVENESPGELQLSLELARLREGRRVLLHERRLEAAASANPRGQRLRKRDRSDGLKAMHRRIKGLEEEHVAATRAEREHAAAVEQARLAKLHKRSRRHLRRAASGSPKAAGGPPAAPSASVSNGDTDSSSDDGEGEARYYHTSTALALREFMLDADGEGGGGVADGGATPTGGAVVDDLDRELGIGRHGAVAMPTPPPRDAALASPAFRRLSEYIPPGGGAAPAPLRAPRPPAADAPADHLPLYETRRFDRLRDAVSTGAVGLGIMGAADPTGAAATPSLATGTPRLAVATPLATPFTQPAATPMLQATPISGGRGGGVGDTTTRTAVSSTPVPTAAAAEPVDLDAELMVGVHGKHGRGHGHGAVSGAPPASDVGESPPLNASAHTSYHAAVGDTPHGVAEPLSIPPATSPIVGGDAGRSTRRQRRALAQALVDAEAEHAAAMAALDVGLAAAVTAQQTSPRGSGQDGDDGVSPPRHSRDPAPAPPGTSGSPAATVKSDAYRVYLREAHKRRWAAEHEKQQQQQQQQQQLSSIHGSPRGNDDTGGYLENISRVSSPMRGLGSDAVGDGLVGSGYLVEEEGCSSSSSSSSPSASARSIGESAASMGGDGSAREGWQVSRQLHYSESMGDVGGDIGRTLTGVKSVVSFGDMSAAGSDGHPARSARRKGGKKRSVGDLLRQATGLTGLVHSSGKSLKDIVQQKSRQQEQMKRARRDKWADMYDIPEGQEYIMKRPIRGRWFNAAPVIHDIAGRPMPWIHPHNTPVLNGAAAVIRNCFTTHFARKERGALRAREAAIAAQQAEIEAAVIIQCMWRVRCARHKVHARREEAFNEFDAEMQELREGADLEDDM